MSSGKALFGALSQTDGDVGYSVGHIRDRDGDIAISSLGGFIDSNTSGRDTDDKPLSAVCSDDKRKHDKNLSPSRPCGWGFKFGVVGWLDDVPIVDIRDGRYIHRLFMIRACDPEHTPDTGRGAELPEGLS